MLRLHPASGLRNRLSTVNPLMLLMIKGDTGSPPSRPSRHRRRPCYTPQSQGHPQQQWKTWWPGIGESCWESLPPTLCVDALGGHLARRWGALLRHLRLPRLGHQARLFVHLDPLLARNRRDQLANRFERQIVRRLEMNATLPHVELLACRLERRLQLLELTRTPKRAHQVERAVVLLRRERDVADRLLVVSVWISRQGDRPADRAPDEALIVAARNVLVHECAHRRDRLRTIGGECGDVLRWRLDVRCWFHGFVVFPNEVCHRRFENQPAAGLGISRN